MPYVRCHLGGTRAPHPEGGSYEWTHDGQVLEVDHDTAAGIVGMPLFAEVHPDEAASEVRQDPPSDGAGESDGESDQGEDGQGEDSDGEDTGPSRRRRTRRTATVRE